MTRLLSLCGSKLWHGFEYLANISVASSNTSHVAHAVNLPFPPKEETVSQHVNAYQKSSPLHLSPKAAAKLWIGIQRLFIPATNSTHSCFSPVEAKPKTRNGYEDNIRIYYNYCDYLMTLTDQILDVYKNPGICFLVVAWGQLSFIKTRAILEGQVTSGYDKFFETCFCDQFLC